jgi:release factor glutamine methyltransferase
VTLALEGADAAVTAVDASAAALELARSNADRLGAHVTFLQSDWFSAIDGTFDLVVSNPPYVAAGDPHLADLRYEPVAALTAGVDGLSCLRHIARTAPKFLAPGGWLLVEHGHDQGGAVRRLLDEAGFRETRTVRDLSAIDRACAGRR